ncbi:hypothetical protein ACT453_47580, partial [Bacillus sp. D-CC]
SQSTSLKVFSNFVFNKLQSKFSSFITANLLKTFKEVDCEADIVKVEDGIFENNDIQTHLSEITIHVYQLNIVSMIF